MQSMFLTGIQSGAEGPVQRVVKGSYGVRLVNSRVDPRLDQQNEAPYYRCCIVVQLLAPLRLGWQIYTSKTCRRKQQNIMYG